RAARPKKVKLTSGSLVSPRTSTVWKRSAVGLTVTPGINALGTKGGKSRVGQERMLRVPAGGGGPPGTSTQRDGSIRRVTPVGSWATPFRGAFASSLGSSG